MKLSFLPIIEVSLAALVCAGHVSTLGQTTEKQIAREQADLEKRRLELERSSWNEKARSYSNARPRSSARGRSCKTSRAAVRSA